MNRRTSVSLVAVAASIALLVTACGGSSGASDSKVASIDDSTASSDENVTTTTSVSFQDAMLEMAACLREHGLDVDDPTFDANGNPNGGFVIGGPDSAIDPSDPETRTAMDECQSVMQNVTPPGGGQGRGPIDRQAVQDSLNDYTACLRDQGLDVDDIEFGGPGGGGAGPQTRTSDGVSTQGPQGGFNGPPPGAGGAQTGEGFDPTDRMIEQLGLDKDDPAVKTAMDACQSILESTFQPVTSTTTA